MGEKFIIGVLVLLALAYVVRSFLRRGGSSCGCEGGCSGGCSGSGGNPGGLGQSPADRLDGKPGGCCGGKH